MAILRLAPLLGKIGFTMTRFDRRPRSLAEHLALLHPGPRTLWKLRLGARWRGWWKLERAGRGTPGPLGCIAKRMCWPRCIPQAYFDYLSRWFSRGAWPAGGAPQSDGFARIWRPLGRKLNGSSLTSGVGGWKCNVGIVLDYTRYLQRAGQLSGAARISPARKAIDLGRPKEYERQARRANSPDRQNVAVNQRSQSR